MRRATSAEAAAEVRSGQRIYLHGGAATPLALLEALMGRAEDLRDVELVHMHTDAPAPYVAPEMRGHFRHNALFIGPNVRRAVAEGRADYTPVFLSEIPALFAPGGPLPLDVALIQVTPPDADGNCSLGVSVDCALSAAEHAGLVIAQVNARMPRTFGHVLPASMIDIAVYDDRDLPSHEPATSGEEAQRIGAHVANLVGDGATLQMGIGEIPNAVLAALSRHRDLGRPHGNVHRRAYPAYRVRRRQWLPQDRAPGKGGERFRRRQRASLPVHRSERGGRAPPGRSHERCGRDSGELPHGGH